MAAVTVNDTRRDDPPQVDRRDFLKGSAAGLTFALTLDLGAMAGDALARSAPRAANRWVTNAADGAVSIVSPPAEMGQGTFTALAAVLADELGVVWARVTVVHPPVWDEKTYGNP